MPTRRAAGLFRVGAGLLALTARAEVVPVASTGDGSEPAVWQSLNPGCGGNVQGLVPDPATPGRLFLCSDMEGLYVSRDYGESWQYLGDELAFSYVNTVEIDPADPARLYAGTSFSLEMSDDGGRRWRRAAGLADSIGQIAVDPSDPRRVFALPGQRYRWGRPFDEDREDVAAGRRRGPFGGRDFYLSTDRGATWARRVYADGDGRRDVLSFDFDPRQSATLYLGALTGIRRSDDGGATWAPLPSPPDTGDCLGAALSPDSGVLYAAFRVPSNGRPAVRTLDGERDLGREGHAHLFATRTAGVSWVNLSEGRPGFALSPRGHTLFWRPRVDPRSTREDHRLLIGTYRPQHGLWRVNVRWTAGAPADVAWRRVLHYDSAEAGFSRAVVPFDIGWERWNIMAEEYRFPPLSWSRQPFVYSTGGQTVFRAPLTALEDPSAWQPVYTRRVGEVEGVPTYRTRGADSLFVFCADAHRNYAIQSVADNGILESWDGGFSWTLDTKPGPRNTSRSNASLVVHGLPRPLVVAHAAIGWGAAERPGALWAKRLERFSPGDRWVMIAGGEAECLAGLPGGTYNQLVSDPHCPRRLYVGCAFNEVYVIDDLDALYGAAVGGRPLPPVASITKGMASPRPRHVTYDSAGLAVDPFDPCTVYLADQQAMWRGTCGTDRRTWSWTRVLPENGETRFAAWALDGATCLVATVPGLDDGCDRLVWSRDRGSTWKPLLGVNDLRALRQPPAWYQAGVPLVAAGLTGHGDRLFLSTVTPRKYGRRPYGVFAVRLGPEGVAGVADLTADAPWPYPVKAFVRPMDDGAYLYLCTRGNGLWRRRVPAP